MGKSEFKVPPVLPGQRNARRTSTKPRGFAVRTIPARTQYLAPMKVDATCRLTGIA
jgi:hypothetical protein